MPSLINVLGNRIPLKRGQTYVLGRGESCDIVVEDLSCSRSHAQITVAPGGNLLFLEDLGSRNGSFLNGEMVRERSPLAEGSRVRIGSTVYLIEIKDSTQEINLAETGTIGFEKLGDGGDLEGGQLAETGLIHVLQKVSDADRSVTVNFALPKTHASVEARDGQIVAARHGDVEGFNALVKLGREQSGIFWVVENDGPCNANISEPTAKILVELGRCLDPAAR